MWVGDVVDVFDGDDMFVVDGDEGGEIGVDGGVVDFFGGWVEVWEDEGVGVVVVFGVVVGGMLVICWGYKRRKKKKKKEKEEEEEEEKGIYSLVLVRLMFCRYLRRVVFGLILLRIIWVLFR